MLLSKPKEVVSRIDIGFFSVILFYCWFTYLYDFMIHLKILTVNCYRFFQEWFNKNRKNESLGANTLFTFRTLSNDSTESLKLSQHNNI